MLAITSSSMNAYAGDSLDKLSGKLITLRGEVEQLNNEINFMKLEHKQEMSFLWTQKNELKSELERNNKLIAHLGKELQKKITVNKEKGQTSAALKPEFMQAITNVEHYLQNSIPFKQIERQAALQEIKEQVFQELISVQRGFNKLWAFVEDEIRLTKETGLYQQSIQVTLSPQKQLVEVARLGMMNLYFQTANNKVGMLTGTPNNWQFEEVNSPVEVKQITYLFESLQKQIRTGLFSLPVKSVQ